MNVDTDKPGTQNEAATYAAGQRVAAYVAARAPSDAEGGWIRRWGGRLFRKWTSAYWRGRQEFVDGREDIAQRRTALPKLLRDKLTQVHEDVRDRKWFEAMELSPILERMESAVVLADGLMRSKWTMWDRKTFAQSEDHATMYRVWRYLVQDLLDAKKVVPPGFREFPFKLYGLWEIQEIFDIVDVLLDSDAICRPSLHFSR